MTEGDLKFIEKSFKRLLPEMCFWGRTAIPKQMLNLIGERSKFFISVMLGL